MESARSALKEATADIHKTIDQHLQEGFRHNPEQGFQDFYRAMHQACIRFGKHWDQSMEELGFTARSAELAELLALDGRLSLNEKLAVDIAQPELLQPRPLTKSSLTRSHQMGIAYAFEGSSLGAKVLLKLAHNYSSSRPEQPAIPIRYLNAVASDAASAAHRWKHFCDALENSCWHRSELIEGALMVFNHLKEDLIPASPPRVTNRMF